MINKKKSNKPNRPMSLNNPDLPRGRAQIARVLTTPDAQRQSLLNAWMEGLTTKQQLDHVVVLFVTLLGTTEKVLAALPTETRERIIDGLRTEADFRDIVGIDEDE